MRKNYYKIFSFLKIFFICELFFYGFNFTYAASVDVGPDITINSPTSIDLNLSAIISGFDLCDSIDYMWTEQSNILFIEMPYEKDMAKIYYSNINNNPGNYTIKLTATCNGGDPARGGFIEEDSFNLTINLSSPNQAPTDIVLDNNNIDENNNIGDIIGNLSTTDPDDSSGTGTYTYELISESGNQSNSFIINGNELKINEVADYETRNSYLVKIKTTDSGGLSYFKEFTININDVVETSASIDAGPNQSVLSGATVYLSGSLSGFPSSGCDYFYNWTSDDTRINIINSGSLDTAYFNTSFTGSNIKIGLLVEVTSTESSYDSCGKTGSYNDIVFITITEENNPPPVVHHGKSSWQRSKEEADRLFKNDESIKNIKLILMEEKASRYQYIPYWNNIGGNGHIEYELLYSTGSKFEKSEEFITKMNKKYFYYTEIDENTDIYFFKVRAKYKGKYSSWSNVLSITNKQNPLNLFKIKCTKCSSNKYIFSDIFESVDLLIEDKFKIECKYCDRKKLKYLYSDILLKISRFDFTVNKNNYCKKKIDYKDIFYQKSDILNLNCNSPNKKIDYSDLLK